MHRTMTYSMRSSRFGPHSEFTRGVIYVYQLIPLVTDSVFEWRWWRECRDKGEYRRVTINDIGTPQGSLMKSLSRVNQ